MVSSNVQRFIWFTFDKIITTLKTLKYAIFFILFTSILPLKSYAGNPNEPYKLPADGLFFNDRITVRFHEFMRSSLVSDQNNNTLQALVKKWGIQKIERRFPEAEIPFEKMRYGKPTVDITLHYNVFVAPVTNLKAMIDDFENSGIAQYAEVNRWYKTFQYAVNDPSVNNYTPSSNFRRTTWYLYRVGATTNISTNTNTAWDLTRGDTSVIVATVDSGSDMDHPDLVPTFFINRREIQGNNIDDDRNGKIDDWRGWDFGGADYSSITADNNPTVTSTGGSHGVHVGGIMAAAGNNGIGIAGVAHGCRQLVVKCGSDNDFRANGSGYISFGYEGITYAAAMGAKVINCSWGGSGSGQTEQAVISAAVINKGAVIVVAAGNDNTEAESYPACYDHVINVAASTVYTADRGLSFTDIKASFTNRNTKVDVMAPGVNILSTYFNNSYQVEQGTSMASPLTAGCVALIRSRFPNLNPFQVEAQLKSTTTPIYQGSGIDDNGRSITMANYRGKLGTGLVNVNNALRQSKPFFEVQVTSSVNTRGQSQLNVGDTLVISATITNALFPSSANCFTTLSSYSSKLRYIGNDTSRIGATNYNDVRNFQPLLRFRVDSILPADFEPLIEMAIFDRIQTLGDTLMHVQAAQLNVVLNTEYINVGTSVLYTSITNNGRIGFVKGYSDSTRQGVGFLYNGVNIVSELGLMVGVGPDSISDNIRTTLNTTGPNSFNYNNDFENLSLQQLVKQRPEGNYYQTKFNDNASATPLGLQIAQTTFVPATAADSNFIIVKYHIKNLSNNNYSNFRLGLFSDWDLSTNGENDRTAFSSSNKLGMIQKYDGARPIAGISLLTNQACNFYSIENNYSGTLAGIVSFLDGFSKSEKWVSMTDNTQPVVSTVNGTDVSGVLSGYIPFLASGDSITFAFAILAGTSQNTLYQSRARAISGFNNYLPVQEDLINSIKSNFSLIPNPAHQIVSLQFDHDSQISQKVIIQDTKGTQIAEFYEVVSGSKLPLPSLSSGLYLVRAQINGNWTTQKLLIR